MIEGGLPWAAALAKINPPWILVLLDVKSDDYDWKAVEEDEPRS